MIYRSSAHLTLTIAALCVGLVAPSIAHAKSDDRVESRDRSESLQYRPIARTGQALPGINGAVTDLDRPSISQGKLIFVAKGTASTKGSVTTQDNGLFSVDQSGKIGFIKKYANYADPNDPSDAVQVTYDLFPSINENTIALRARKKKEQFGTVFKTDTIDRSADGIVKEIYKLESSRLSTGLSGFVGVSKNAVTFVDRTFGGTLLKLVNGQSSPTAVIGLENLPGELNPPLPEDSPLINGDRILFGTDGQLWTAQGKNLQKITNNTIKLPSGEEKASSLCGYSFTNNAISYCKSEFDTKYTAIFVQQSKKLHKVVDSRTPHPHEKRYLEKLSAPIVSGNSVAFIETRTGSNVQSIYVKRGKRLQQIIQEGAQIEGKSIAKISVGNQFFSNGSVTFVAQFSDGSKTLYRVDRSQDDSKKQNSEEWED